MKQQTKRQQQAYESKQKLFAGALYLFATRQYEDVTVQDICAQSDMSVGAFYHHFKNKESILDEGYRLFDERLKEKWDRAHLEDNLDIIRFLVEEQLKSMASMGHLAAAQYFKNQLTSSEKYILNPDRFFFRAIRDAVQAEKNSGRLIGDTYTIVEDILSITRGIIYDWCLHEDTYSLKDKGRRGLDMVLNYYVEGGK
ncbi:TetR/AcrR family transcriptional regulator [Ruminococcaceae bacterium OttesenSCG-928-O06]|nr:TetR/AcrR family transcriptional regulator [Ruminococcaceae bacterium OttesenSCG-928-O06]